MGASAAHDPTSIPCSTECAASTNTSGIGKLFAAGRPSGRCASTSLFCHDGTERPIGRPTDDEDQKHYYSGKKKDHTIKNVLIVDETGAICFLSDTYEGKTHDKRIADEAHYQLPDGSILAQDSGFQGFTMPGVSILQPKKKPPRGTLTDEEKEENQWIARIRSLIEHSIGGVKIYRIIHDTIRHWCPWIRDTVMHICCGLYNLRLRQQELRES